MLRVRIKKLKFKALNSWGEKFRVTRSLGVEVKGFLHLRV